jgi:hypothetical protein
MTPTLNKFSSIKVLTSIACNNCNAVSATIIQVHKMLSRTSQLSYIHLHWARYFFMLLLLPNNCSRHSIAMEHDSFRLSLGISNTLTTLVLLREYGSLSWRCSNIANLLPNMKTT